MTDPRQPHLNAAHRILHYLKGTPGLGILLPRLGGCLLTAHCDFDWLGCPYTRRSRTGYLLSLGGAPISWKTKKQSVVSRSSAEAEYRSMAAAQHIANNPVFHEHTKHVKMDCYFVRERVESKEVEPLSVKSTMQIVDLLTKGLGTNQLRFLLDKLGVRNLHAPT
ncbi:secreted RxLR effector protein 161-like protein [Tanacetum coccineum]